MKNILFFISLSFCVGFTTSTTLAQQRQIDSLYKVVQTFKNEKNFEADTSYVNTIYQLATAYRYVQMDSMHYYAQIGLQLSQKIDYKNKQPRLYRLIGAYYYENNDYANAIFYYKQGLIIAQSIKDQESIAFAYYNLSLAHNRIADYTLALDFSFQAVAYFEKVIKYNKSLLAWLAHTYTSIAYTYQDQELWDKSIEYNHKSIQISQATNYIYGIATSLSNIGHIYIKQGKYQQGFDTLSKSNIVLDKLDISASDKKYVKSYNFFYMGLAYLKQNKLEEALSYTKQSYHISLESKNKTNQVEFGNQLIAIYFQLAQYSKVLEYGLPILAIAKEIDAKVEIKRIAQTLANVYEVKRSYKEAFDYQKLAKAYTDSVFNNESRKKILQMEAKFEYEQKENILKKNQQIVNIENEKKLTQQKYYTYTAFAIVFTLFLIIALVQRSRKIQQELNKQLSNQNNTLQKQQEEITSQNEELSQQQEQLAHINIRLEEEVTIKQKLIETQNRELLNYALKMADSNDFLEEVKKGIMSQENPQQNKNLLSKIESSQNKEKDWDIFKKMFEDVNPTFFRQLAISYPELTAQELKLCALIKLNLSSKDIASILRITPESVYKARYRTRKKMNIDNEENLNNLLFKME